MVKDISNDDNLSSLQQQVLKYINSREQGTKVAEMEQPLNKSRIQIGFAAQCLLDLGKIIKNGNLYYPGTKYK